MPDDIAELVADHPLLAGLPGDTVARVAGCARNVAFAPDQLVLEEGKPAGAVYLLRRGRVALEVHAPGRGPLIIETLGPGQVLGWSWLFPPYLWHFDARTLEPVGAIELDAQCLRDKAENDAAFGFELIRRFASVMLERLDATRLRLLDLYGDGTRG